MKEILIDITKLSKEENDLLVQFLKQNPSEVIWHAGQTYPLTEDIQLKFSHNIIKRERKQNREGVRYECQDPSLEPLGEGSYGKVYPLVGNFSLKKDEQNNDSIEYKGYQKKSRVMKSIITPDGKILSTDKAHLHAEYQNALQAPHLSVKPPIVSESEGVLIMEKLEGQSLDKLLEKPLTVTQRFQLTAALFKTVEEQLVNKDLVHCDLKPDNIIVNLQEDSFVANIIDYDSCVQQGTPKAHNSFGTVGYIPPEAESPGYKNFTPSYDIYSLGKILTKIWGGRINASTQEGTHLFGSINTSGMEKSDQEAIRDMIFSMVAPESSRSSFQEALEAFNKIEAPQQNSEILAKPEVPEMKANACPQISPTQKMKLEVQLQIILSKATTLKQKHPAAALAAEELHKTVSDAKNSYFNGHVNADTFKTTCEGAIKNARKSELTHHRGCKNILLNLALAISGLGVGYVIAGLANFIKTRGEHFFFKFNTDSSHQIDELEKLTNDTLPKPK